MPYSEFSRQTKDGLALFARDWRPDGTVKAVIGLVHGIGEHSGRYELLALALNQAGYAVVVFDLRGHGRSGGRRGHSPSYEALMGDVDHLVQAAASRYPEAPLFLYGHSLGGNLVLNYLLRRQPRLAGAIVTGPMLRTAVPTSWWKMLVGRILSHVWPSFTLSNGLKAEDLSRDDQVVSEYKSDPLVHDRLSARLGIDVYDSGLWALEHADSPSTPLLLMHGAADRITSVEASREFAARAGDLCTLVIWPDAVHEIHKAPDKEKIFAGALNWLDHHR